MKGLIPTFILSSLVFSILLKLAFHQGYLELGTDLVSEGPGRYTCHYSTLWCSCWSAGNGCELGCSSSLIKTLYNQTSCHPRDKLILTGFSLSV